MILTGARFGQPLAAHWFRRQDAARIVTAPDTRDEAGADEEDEGKGPEDTHRIDAPESKTGSISSGASYAGIPLVCRESLRGGR